MSYDATRPARETSGCPVGIESDTPTGATGLVVTLTTAGATPSYASSEAAVSTAIVTSDARSPPASPSSTPVTVTSWGAFQSAGTNVNEGGETVAAAGVSPVTVSTTSVPGCDPSDTATVSWV